MAERLTYTHVRQRLGLVNKMAHISPNGSPIVKRRQWVVGALTLENCGYGTWSVAKVTNKTGGVHDLHRGTLRSCDAYVAGMLETFTLLDTLKEGKTC